MIISKYVIIDDSRSGMSDALQKIATQTIDYYRKHWKIVNKQSYSGVNNNDVAIRKQKPNAYISIQSFCYICHLMLAIWTAYTVELWSAYRVLKLVPFDPVVLIFLYGLY